MNTTAKPQTQQKINIYEVFKYTKDEKHVFLSADLFFGSAALWIPLLLGVLLYTKTSLWGELLKLLDSGGGYTFALAYLAAGSSFLYLDRKKGTINDFRDEVSPNILTSCLISMAIGVLLTGTHFTNQIHEPGKSDSLLNWVEFFYLLWVVYLGIRLFCLKNIDKLPGKLDHYIKSEQEKAKQIAEAGNSDEPY
jgi:hypothetical protein